MEEAPEKIVCFSNSKMLCFSVSLCFHTLLYHFLVKISFNDHITFITYITNITLKRHLKKILRFLCFLLRFHLLLLDIVDIIFWSKLVSVTLQYALCCNIFLWFRNPTHFTSTHNRFLISK